MLLLLFDHWSSLFSHSCLGCRAGSVLSVPRLAVLFESWESFEWETRRRTSRDVETDKFLNPIIIICSAYILNSNAMSSLEWKPKEDMSCSCHPWTGIPTHLAYSCRHPLKKNKVFKMIPSFVAVISCLSICCCAINSSNASEVLRISRSDIVFRDTSSSRSHSSSSSSKQSHLNRREEAQAQTSHVLEDRQQPSLHRSNTNSHNSNLNDYLFPDKHRPEPTFDETTPRNITVASGKTVYLPCKVRHLGERTVSISRCIYTSCLTIWGSSSFLSSKCPLNDHISECPVMFVYFSGRCFSFTSFTALMSCKESVKSPPAVYETSHIQRNKRREY